MRILSVLPLLALAAPAAAQAPAVPVTLDVMTYNVHGLPWPIAADRTADLRAIAAGLRGMRAGGAGPHVVVLQEAFTRDARAIGRLAGFRYVARGPSARAGAPGGGMPTDPYRLKGEGLGSWLSSGLVILSDYPILALHTVPFARDACAGYDCLANKGVALAEIAVPGVAAPVQVATAHINSRQSTGTPLAHANLAYRREIDALGAFLHAQTDARAPLIVAGDFNVDHDAGRLAYLSGSVPGWFDARAPLRPAAVALCGGYRGACAIAADAAASDLGRRTNDWQFARAGSAVGIAAEASAIRFAPDASGHALSDHQALEVRYRLTPLAVPARA